MHYVVSLIDRPEHVQVLSDNAREMYFVGLMAQQEILCGLEDSMPMIDVIKISEKLNATMVKELGQLAAALSRPLSFTIPVKSWDDAVDETLLDYSKSVGIMAIVNIGNEFKDKLRSTDLLHNGTGWVEELFENVDDFIEEAKKIYIARVDEFIEMVKVMGIFSATCHGDTPAIEGTEVDLELMESRK